MDWIALQASPLWKELWESPELAAKKQKILSLLLNGSWDEKTLAYLKGQLTALDELPKMVFELAKKQALEEKKAKEEHRRVLDPHEAAILNMIPEIS